MAKLSIALTLLGANAGQFAIYPSKKVAKGEARVDDLLVSSEAELAQLLEDGDVTQTQLLELHNFGVGWLNELPDTKVTEKTLSKFRNKEQALNRTFTIFEMVAEATGVKAPQKEEGDGTRGRKSEFAGCTIFPTKESLKENPRRPEFNGTPSKGFAAMEIVRGAPKGITFEDYIAQGGAANHLRWDLNKGNLIVKDPEGKEVTL